MYRISTNFSETVVNRLPSTEEILKYYTQAYKAGIPVKEIKLTVTDISPKYGTMTDALFVGMRTHKGEQWNTPGSKVA